MPLKRAYKTTAFVGRRWLTDGIRDSDWIPKPNDRADEIVSPPREMLEVEVQKLTQKIVAGMSVEEKVGQMLDIRVTMAHPHELTTLVRMGAVGAITIGDHFKYDTPDTLLMLINFFNWNAKYPILWRVTAAQGLAKLQVMHDGMLLQPLPLIGKWADESKSELKEYVQGIEVGRAGINASGWIHADLCDLDKVCRVEGYAYQTDPVTTKKLALAALRGARRAGSCCCGCHWIGYGHGDLRHTLSEVREDIEIWQSLFKTGLDSIMVVFGYLTDLDPDNMIPYSSACIKHLREDVGFGDGMICVDSFNQADVKAIDDLEQAVMCINAGCDMMLPKRTTNPLILFDQIMKAYREGRLHPQNIEDAARRVTAYKVRNRVAQKCSDFWPMETQEIYDGFGKLEKSAGEIRHGFDRSADEPKWKKRV